MAKDLYDLWTASAADLVLALQAGGIRKLPVPKKPI